MSSTMMSQAVAHDPLGLGEEPVNDEGELVAQSTGDEDEDEVVEQTAQKEKQASSSSAAEQILNDEPFSSSSSSTSSSSTSKPSSTFSSSSSSRHSGDNEKSAGLREELFGGKRTSVFGESTFEVTEAVPKRAQVDAQKSSASSSSSSRKEGSVSKGKEATANDTEKGGAGVDEQKFDEVDLRSPSSTVRAPTGYEHDEVDDAAERRRRASRGEGKQLSSEELDVVVTKLESFPPPMTEKQAKRAAARQSRQPSTPTRSIASRRSASPSSSSSSSSSSAGEDQDQVYDIGVPVTHIEEPADEEPYAVYHIEFSLLSSPEPLTVVKRFSQIYNLHEALRTSFPDEEMPSFPSRIVLGGSLDPKVIDERQKLLDKYLKELLVNKRLWNSFHIKLFLNLYDLTGKVAIVTGASSGVGLQTALALARLNAHVVLACRSREKAEAVIHRIKEETGNDKLEFIELDLASLDSVRQFVTEFTKRGLPLNYLINNAGVAGEVGKLTQDGFEIHMGVNYIGHFLLTNLLLDELNSTATKCGEKSRIINVASRSHLDSRELFMSDSYLFNPTTKTTLYPAFVQSKLALVTFTNELAIRLEGMRVVVHAVHPGPVATDTFFKQAWNPIPFSVNWLSKKFLLSQEEGARCTLYAALAEETASVSGRYFESCQERAPNPITHNRGAMSQLWEHSEAWTGVAE